MDAFLASLPVKDAALFRLRDDAALQARVRAALTLSVDEYAAQGMLGHLQAAHALAIPWTDTTCAAAAKGGHLDCLMFVHTTGAVCDARAMRHAVRFGHLDCVVYLLEKACPAPDNALDLAVYGGSEAIVQQLRTRGGVAWSGTGAEYTRAASEGNVAMLRALRTMACPAAADPRYNHTTTEAAKGGHLAALCYAHEILQCPLHSACVTQAVERGDVDMLEYLMQENAPLLSSEKIARRAVRTQSKAVVECLLDYGLAFSETQVAAAVYNGSFDIFALLVKAKVPFDPPRIRQGIAGGPNIADGDQPRWLAMAEWHRPVIRLDRPSSDMTTPELLMYLERIPAMRQTLLETHDISCAAAASVGDLATLTLMHAVGRPWDAETCYQAARGGHFDCLRYARENGCPWDTRTLTAAIINDHVRCAWYAFTNGCPRDETDPVSAALSGSLPCLRFAKRYPSMLVEDVCTAAAESGSLACLEYARDKGCPWSTNAVMGAIGGGSLTCLRYARENGCPWPPQVCLVAIQRKKPQLLEYALPYKGAEDTPEIMYAIAFQNKHLACVRVLHEAGVPWTVETAAVAAGEGHLEGLVYLHEGGCPWDKTAALGAAENGKVHTLAYIHAQDGPWDGRTMRQAALFGHLECLRYALEHDCPYDASEIVLSAVMQNHTECVLYLLENARPVDPRTPIVLMIDQGHFAMFAAVLKTGYPRDRVPRRLLEIAIMTRVPAAKQGPWLGLLRKEWPE